MTGLSMDRTRHGVRRNAVAGILAGLFAVAVLGGCAKQEERPQAAASPSDDDAYCQAKGLKPGSDAYVNCRKDRDYAATALPAQQKQRDVRKIQDYMMDNK
jgi:hypothetical protein